MMSFFDKLKPFGPPSRDKFAQSLRNAVLKAGEKGKVLYDRENFRLLVEGEKNQLFLDNAYREYISIPRNEQKAIFQKWVRMWFVHLREIPVEYDDIKHDLLPVLKPRIYYETIKIIAETDGNVIPDWPYQILEDPLVVGMVYDEPESTKTINQENLDHWGVTLYETMEVARANLEKLPFHYLGPGEDKEGIYVSMTGDSYDATRLILLDRIRSFKVKGKHVAMVPNRETLIVTGSEDEEGLKAMVDLGKEALQQSRLISGFTFRLEEDDWLRWLPAPSHPLYVEFREMQIHSVGQDYHEQKELFEKLHQTKNIDIFVASYRAMQDDSKMWSFCVWPKGCNALLPKTDTIIFLEGESNPIMVEWNKALEAFDDLMEQQDIYPTRWLVQEYPDKERLLTIGKEVKK
jgi:hypothetical protein